MRFKGLDLNLLVALDALLETRSVTAASRRLNLSQPAVSAALARLRDYFHDDILVADGKRMLPTAYAEALAPRLKAQLSGLIDAERVLKRVNGIAITHFTSADVVRHPLVARIVDAYDNARKRRT